jgi:hypothetical protein
LSDSLRRVHPRLAIAPTRVRRFGSLRTVKRTMPITIVHAVAVGWREVRFSTQSMDATDHDHGNSARKKLKYPFRSRTGLISRFSIPPRERPTSRVVVRQPPETDLDHLDRRACPASSRCIGRIRTPARGAATRRRLPRRCSSGSLRAGYLLRFLTHAPAPKAPV